MDSADVYEYSPEELVDKALKTLQDAGIELIEWSSLLYRRMNVPVIVKVSERNFFMLNDISISPRIYRTSTISFLTTNWTLHRSYSLSTRGCHDPSHRLSLCEPAATSTERRACTALPDIRRLPSHSTSSSTPPPSQHIPLRTSPWRLERRRFPSHYAGPY